MTETNAALLAGLPGDVRALLARPPLTDTRLLELAARWEGLTPPLARMADALRLFVVTWDPLEWLAPRPEAVATANAWPLEIVVYVTVWSLAEMARQRETTMAAVLAGLGGRAVATAAAHEDAVTSGRYAELAARGEAPALLSGNPGPALEKAVIVAESAEWEAIGLGAITDFVQQAFGPVELDRSLVELTVTAAPRPGCPACAGRRFKFPADLADSRDRMCPAHRNEADAVIRRRMGRAGASNPAGWRMLADASARLSLPHLPGGLATRLAAAEKDLVRRARLLAEAAAGFPGRPDDFGSALAENQDQAGRFPASPGNGPPDPGFPPARCRSHPGGPGTRPRPRPGAGRAAPDPSQPPRALSPGRRAGAAATAARRRPRASAIRPDCWSPPGPSAS